MLKHVLKTIKANKKIKKISFFETSVATEKSTWRNIPEDQSLHWKLYLNIDKCRHSDICKTQHGGKAHEMA